MRRINSKYGFTIIEMLTAFALATVVMVFLFNIVFLLKDSYTRNDSTGTTVLELSRFSNNMNKDFTSDAFKKIGVCGTGTRGCYTFVKNTARPETMTLEIFDNKLVYSAGNTGEVYTYLLAETDSIGEIKVCHYTNEEIASDQQYVGYEMNSYFYLKIEIDSTLDDFDNSVKIVWPYNVKDTYNTGGTTTVTGISSTC